MNSRNERNHNLLPLSVAANVALVGLAFWQHRRLQGSEQARKLDPKTGLLTYPAFVKEVEERIKPTRRFSELQRIHGLIIGDLDDFKSWNDTLKYSGADRRALLPAAEHLKAAVRPDSDLVGRFGGEEVVIFLHDTDLVGTITVCERVQDGINSIRPDGSSPLGITLSYATLNQGGDYEHTFEQASSALVEAKQIPGKNQIVAADL